MASRALTVDERKKMQFDSHRVPGDRDDREQDTLVTMHGGIFRISEYMQWYRGREYNIRFSKRSREGFTSSVEQMVWRMVRDRLLMARAVRRNLHSLPAVVDQRKWWEEKALYEFEKETLASGIHMTDSLLESYYEQHSREFVDSLGGVRPFSLVKDDVARLAHESALTAKMLRRVLELKRKYPVAIMNDVLSKLPVDDEHQPKAIDLYVGKNGGTFPRPAFPTIDVLWRTWE
jgi:hypothetical protein